MHPRPRQILLILVLAATFGATAQETRLLRQPNLGPERVAFVYGGDIWTADLQGKDVKRITSTPAVDENPHFSPDGKMLAFNSNRYGATAVLTVSTEGGMPTRLTFHPAGARVRGWTPDGKHILFASSRQSAPVSYDRLWTIPVAGGPVSEVTAQWGYDGSYSPDGKQLALDKMSRWDVEWRAYRGGQNTPLIVLNLEDQSEVLIPNDKTTDV